MFIDIDLTIFILSFDLDLLSFLDTIRFHSHSLRNVPERVITIDMLMMFIIVTGYWLGVLTTLAILPPLPDLLLRFLLRSLAHLTLQLCIRFWRDPLNRRSRGNAFLGLFLFHCNTWSTYRYLTWLMFAKPLIFFSKWLK